MGIVAMLRLLLKEVTFLNMQIRELIGLVRQLVQETRDNRAA